MITSQVCKSLRRNVNMSIEQADDRREGKC